MTTNGMIACKKKKRALNFLDDDTREAAGIISPASTRKDFEDEDNKNPDYFVDFYEDKNYEYIDQDDSESMSFDELDANLFKMKFDFNNIDYDNYEYEEVGVLNFRYEFLSWV